MVEKAYTPKRTITSLPLGKSLRLGAKTLVTVSEPGVSITYHVETVEVLIGIGNDHTATLIMTRDAFEAFQQESKLHTTTFQEHLKSLKNGRKKRR